MFKICCKVSIELFQMPNETICIEFTRMAGDSWLFFDEFRTMRDTFEFLDNALLD